MKKIISLLLCLLMVASVFAACDDSDETSSTAPSVSETESTGDTSTDESTDTSDDVSQPEPVVDDTGLVNDTVFDNKTLISVGAEYKSTTEAKTEYPDTYGSELTDGIMAERNTSYTDGRFSAYDPQPASIYDRTESMQVVIDLGKEYNNITSFAVSYFLNYNAGISAPSSISVAISTDGEKYTNLGKLKTAKKVDLKCNVFTLAKEEYLTARYVRFTVYQSGGLLFFDEMMVFADIPATEVGVDIKEVANKIYASETSAFANGLAQYATDKAPEREYSKTLISKGKSYKTDGKTVGNFPDAKKLTNGETSTSYESGTWVGYNASQDTVITVDLGKTVDDIGTLAVNAMTISTAKLYLSPCVVFSVSNDNKEFTDIARAYAPSNITDGSYVYTINFRKCVSARYVRFTLKAAGQGTLLVDEVGVYAYRADEDMSLPLYPTPEFPDKGQITYFDSNVADYNKVQNLILGKTDYSVIPDAILSKSEGDDNTPLGKKMLTDGIVPRSYDIHDGSYFKCHSSFGRQIIFDLGASCALTEISAVFMRNSGTSVIMPGEISIELSQDAENWYKAGVIKYDSKQSNVVLDRKLTLESAVQARYVRYNFPVTVWTAVGEVRAIGTKNASGATLLADAGFVAVESVSDNGYQDTNPEILGGASDIVLIYQAANADKNDLLPYVAYTDKEGNMKDVMFDGYLFLYYGQMPSGAMSYGETIKTDWEWALNNAFGQGINANALEAAAGEAKEKLGLPADYKYKYYLSIYYPRSEVTKFGDVDGDGKSENLSKDEDRLKVIKWFIDEALKKDKEANFKNIELQGFYWFHENMEEEPGDGITNWVADELDEKGYDFFWIPYFGARGVENWKEFGFDAACLQPNYFFKLETPLSRIEAAASIAKRFGLSIEFEVDENAFKNRAFFQKYMQYLMGGVYYGYMENSMHMYYQSDLFNTACRSDDPMSRAIYDNTYKFIKGTLDITLDAVNDVKLGASKDTVFEGKLEVTKAELVWYNLVDMPEHGTITFNEDGTFTYYPDKGFTGTDTFTFTYCEGLEDSPVCTVEITVE